VDGHARERALGQLQDRRIVVGDVQCPPEPSREPGGEDPDAAADVQQGPFAVHACGDVGCEEVVDRMAHQQIGVGVVPEVTALPVVTCRGAVPVRYRQGSSHAPERDVQSAYSRRRQLLLHRILARV
jgi:hypothetical protein